MARPYDSVTYYVAACFLTLSLALGGALVFVSTQSGPGVTTDSVSYLSVARNLAAGRGCLVDGGYWLDGTPSPSPEMRRPFALQPPFYPALLALGVKAGLPVVAAARWLGILSHVLLIAVIFLLTRTLAGNLYACLAAFSVAMFQPLLASASFAWSESSFMWLSLLALFCLVRSWRQIDGKRRTLWLVLAGLVSALALLTRYAAIVQVAVGIVAIALATPRQKLAERLAAYAGPIAIVGGPWFVRNLLLTGYITGYARVGPHLPVVENVRLLTYTLMGDLLPHVHLGFKSYLLAHPILAGSFLFCSVAIPVGSVWAMHRRGSRPGTKIAARRTASERFIRLPRDILWIYVFAYLGFLVWSSVTMQYPAYDWPRYLSVIYPVIIVAGLATLRDLCVSVRLPAGYTLAAASLLAGLWLMGQVGATWGYVAAAAKGQEYTAPAWRSDPAIAQLSELVEDGDAIFTDQTSALQFYLDQPAYPLPSMQCAAGLQAITQWAATRPQSTYIVIYKGQMQNKDPFALYQTDVDATLKAAARNSRVQLVQETTTAFIFRVAR